MWSKFCTFQFDEWNEETPPGASFEGDTLHSEWSFQGDDIPLDWARMATSDDEPSYESESFKSENFKRVKEKYGVGRLCIF